MDVLAAGLASKAKRIAEENERDIGQEPEDRFKDVGQRLAYLENQAAGLIVELVRQIDKTKASMTDTAWNGSVFTLSPTVNGFKKEGVIESGVLDLGDAMHEVLSVIVEEQKTTGQHVTAYADYSYDNITWQGYLPLPLASMPKARYWKLKVEMRVDVAGEVSETKTASTMAGLVAEGKSSLEGSTIESVNTESFPMTGQTVDETNTLYSVTFEKPTTGVIGSVTFKEG